MTVANEIMAFLAVHAPIENDDGHAPADLAEALGTDAKSLSGTLTKLDREGFIVRERRGTERLCYAIDKGSRFEEFDADEGLAPAALQAEAPRDGRGGFRLAARAINAYLATCDAGLGYKEQTTENLEARVGKLDAQMAEKTGVSRVKLLQQKREIMSELEARKNGARVVDGFIEHALAYSKVFGIEYETWRDAGVPAKVLADAGITR